MTPPRLFGIVASKAPIVAVLRRGPSAWTHVGKWDLAHDQFEGGAWIKSNLYPQRCDVSPDGELFAYLAARGPGPWAAGSTYLAIARLPWVFALAAWGTCGTWTRGVHFVTDEHDHEAGDPDEGTVTPMRERYGLAYNRPVAFAVERRGGWVEAEGTPPRDPDGDPRDEQRAPHVVMEKPQPGTPAIALRVQGSFAAFREGPFRDEPRDARYTLLVDGREDAVDDVQWADWAADGRLVVATSDGRLQTRTVVGGSQHVLWEHGVAGLRPDPTPAPPEARRWCRIVHDP